MFQKSGGYGRALQDFRSANPAKVRLNVHGVGRNFILAYQIITKTRLFKYIENFTSKKTENFQIKKLETQIVGTR